MVAQFIWLLLSHSMLIGIGGALVDAGNTSSPIRFRIMLGLELSLIAFLWVSIAVTV